MSTTIEYLDETINPIQDSRKGKSGRGYHCTKCSPGCQNCWAEIMNMRFGNGQPFDDTPVKFEIVESELAKLRKWKKARYVGVQFMGDLFHKDVPFYMVDRILGIIQKAKQHTSLILTKRPERMAEHFRAYTLPEWSEDRLPNLHGGLTICNQQEADEKIPIFLQIPFATHVLSIEPMLGPVDIRRYLSRIWTPRGQDYPTEKTIGIDSAILGGESGSNARPMHPDWVRSVRDQCQESRTSFFFKQYGEWIPEQLLSTPAKNLFWSQRYQSNWGTLDIDGNWFPETTPWNGKQGEDSDTKEYVMYKVGKKQAGRLLDCRTWEERP